MKRAVTILHNLAKSDSRLWMLYDAFIALLAFHFVLTLLPQHLSGDIVALQLAVFPAIVIVAGTISGFYDKDTLVRFWKLIFSITLMAVIAILGLSLFANVVLYEKIGRHLLIILAVLLLFGTSSLRIFAYVVARYYKIKVLLIGNERMWHFISKKVDSFNGRYSLIGFCDGDGSATEGALGDFSQIPDICRDYKVNLLVISDYYTRHPRLLDKCLQPIKSGCKLVDESMFFERASETVLVDRIDPSWFYTSKINVHNNFQVLVKRVVDIFFAIVGLLITAIIFPFIWLAIKLTAGGGVFYSQIRSGQFGQPFKIHKFCTMLPDAEKNGAQWAQKNDDRITKAGRFLRKTRVDELPQFWNVLKGEMSFVGPRPERPELVKKIEEHVPYFSFRHWVKPGITGFAQIRYRYGASVEDAEEKLKYDLYYIKNWSILLDLQVILRTISTVMKGAY